MTILVTYQKDQGKVRERQEDSCFALADEQKSVLILSDGMGGHAAGDLASQAAVAAALEVLERWPHYPPDMLHENNGHVEAANGTAKPPDENGLSSDSGHTPDGTMTVDEWVKSGSGDMGDGSADRGLEEEAAAEIPHRTKVVAALQNTFTKAQRAVSDVGLDVAYGLGSAGCTLTVALITNGWLHVGHIGDSRAYLFRSGHLEQLTLDHSGATLLVSAGIITPEEARYHPESHSLYRFLGINAVELTVDVHHEKLETDDVVLLCSDGLWGMLPDEVMANLLQQIDNIEDVATALLTHANSAGGEDNISVAIAKV